MTSGNALICRFTCRTGDLARTFGRGSGDIHRMIYSMYPWRTEDDKAANRALYRDMGEEGGFRRIVFLSAREPYAPSFGKLETRLLPENWLSHDRYLFEVVVNARKDVKKGRGRGREERGKPTAILGADNIREWFDGMSERWGFSCENIFVDGYGTDDIRYFRRKDRPYAFHVKGDVILNKALVKGALRVTGREKFIQSALRGIGKGKAYGCGLLQLTPYRPI